MPLYSFTCKECGTTEEKLQSFETEAPSCCGNHMDRQFATNFMLCMGKQTPFMRAMNEPESKTMKAERRYRDKRAG